MDKVFVVTYEDSNAKFTFTLQPLGELSEIMERIDEQTFMQYMRPGLEDVLDDVSRIIATILVTASTNVRAARRIFNFFHKRVDESAAEARRILGKELMK